MQRNQLTQQEGYQQMYVQRRCEFELPIKQTMLCKHNIFQHRNSTLATYISNMHGGQLGTLFRPLSGVNSPGVVNRGDNTGRDFQGQSRAPAILFKVSGGCYCCALGLA